MPIKNKVLEKNNVGVKEPYKVPCDLSRAFDPQTRWPNYEVWLSKYKTKQNIKKT